MPGAVDVIASLRRDFRVVLLTQGDEQVQRKRIADSQLEPLFDHIRIVPKKSPELLTQLLNDLVADPGSAWMVGNSIPSDVNPALAVGMKAIWVDADVWEHERRENAAMCAGLTQIGALVQVPEVIRRR